MRCVRLPDNGPVSLALPRPSCYNPYIITIKAGLPVRTRAQKAVSLVVILVLAASLTAVASGRVTARSTLQLSPADTRSPAATPSWAPTATQELPPVTPTIEAEPSPITQPTLAPVAPETTDTNPGVSGFLPAPTLTNPDDLRNNPPAVYRPNTASPEPTPEPAPTPITIGGLIREGLVALSYLWLCVGVILLVGIGAAVVWLARRAARRSPPHG